MEKKTQSFLASCGMLVTAMIWGFAFVVVKDVVSVIPPVYMIAFRFTIAGAGLIIVFFNRLKKLTLSVFIHGCFIGVFLFLAYLVQTIGIQYTTAGKNAFLTTIYVVLVPLILWLLTRRPPEKHILVAALITIVGIGLLSLQDDLSINKGDILTIICSFGFAIQIILIAKYTVTEDAVLLAIVQIVATAVLGWITAPFFDGPVPLAGLTNKTALFSVFYLGIFSTLIGFLLQNVCQKYTPPSIAAIFLSFESVFGVVFSFIFLHEVLTLRMTIGCILLLLAILLAETKFSFIIKPFRKKFSSCSKP